VFALGWFGVGESGDDEGAECVEGGGVGLGGLAGRELVGPPPVRWTRFD
jgi:hypothetical protein